MNRVFLALVAVLVLAALGYFFWANRDQPAPAQEPAATDAQTLPAPPDQAGAPAVSGLKAGDAEERHLVGIVLRQDKEQSQAHIMRRGVTGVYRLQDKVPPDQALLTAINMNHVTLQPAGGKEIVLKLENLTDEERFLYSPEVNLDEVEDVVGNLYEAETPQGKALLEKYPDPHARCAAFKDEAEQEKCEDEIDAEMEAAAEKCETIDDPDEYDECLETAYRFTAEAAARAKAQ